MNLILEIDLTIKNEESGIPKMKLGLDNICIDIHPSSWLNGHRKACFTYEEVFQILREHVKQMDAKPMIHTIKPYVSKWGNQRVWVFDDPEKGLINEGLVSGTDAFLDAMAGQIPNAEEGFSLAFSDQPFEGHILVFDWVRSGTGEGLADGFEGNWYRLGREWPSAAPLTTTDFEGWLCPALFKYFDAAPKKIYLKFGPLEGKLERGTGKVIIQGKDSQE